MTMRIEPIPPRPGQESVWDYPRPPRLEGSPKRIRILVGGETIVDSVGTKRVLETSHPPVYYIPPEDIRMDLLLPSPRKSWCEWKGTARYFSLQVGDDLLEDVAWTYPSPVPAFEPIRDHVAFYPSRMDQCYVDHELARAQEGDFYGGWITSDIVGPFKGEAGTRGW